MFRGYQKLTKILIINDFIVDSPCKLLSLAIIAVALGFVQQLMCIFKMQNRLRLRLLISILCQHNSPSLISNHFSILLSEKKNTFYLFNKRTQPTDDHTNVGRLREYIYIQEYFITFNRVFCFADYHKFYILVMSPVPRESDIRVYNKYYTCNRLLSVSGYNRNQLFISSATTASKRKKM